MLQKTDTTTQICASMILSWLVKIEQKKDEKIYNNQQAIDIVDLAFEGKYSPIFLLDNSPIHRLMIRLENNYMIAKY